ncbi:MAG: DUF3137 domain-containing protein [Fimbriimonas sp.]
MPTYLFVLMVAVLCAFIVGASLALERRNLRQEEARQAALRELAEEFGGEFYPHGLRKRDDWSTDGRQKDIRFLRRFEAMEEWGLIEEGRVENLLAIRFPEVDLYAFDFVWRGKNILRQRVVAARITSRLPRLLIAPRVSAFRAYRHSWDVPLVEVEWEEFNRRYEVRSEDAKGAHAVLTPEIMAMLCETDARSWGIGGCQLVAYDHGLDVHGERRMAEERETLRTHLSFMRAFVAQIPAYLVEEGATGHRWESPLH